MTRVIGEILGAAYDVDDTLLNNHPDHENRWGNLHQQARLVALHELAERYDIPALAAVTPEDNFGAFARSPVHTVSGAFWVVLHERGILGEVFDPLDPLILELVTTKNQAYAELLAKFGAPYPGAVEFVRDLSQKYGLEGKNAIASTATHDDIQTFLGMTGLTDIIPEERIISVEDVTHPKPHPEAFDKAFRTMKLPDKARSRVAALEDDPRGMKSARDAGLFVIAITSRYSREFLEKVDAKPDIIVDSYPELRDVCGLPPLPE